MGAQRQAGDDAERSAPAALQGPEQIGILAGIGDPQRTVGGHDLGLQQARRGGAVVLREAAEAAALDETGDADRAAAAALDVAPALGRHRVVGVHPDRAGADGDRGLRRILTSLRHEIVMQGDVVHEAGPDHQRIRRVRGAEIAVAAALDDQAQIVVPREIDRGDHVAGLSGCDRVGAGLEGPAVDPAERLRDANLVANEVGVLQLLEQRGASLRVR